MAWRVSFQISKWSEPQKYYVSFPFGIMDHNIVRQYRKVIRNKDKNLIFTKDGKDVRDNIHLSFTMTPDDFKNCRGSVNRRTTKGYYPPEEGELYPSKKLPLKDRWSARYFELSDVFAELETNEATFVEPEWFYDVLNWEGYEKFIRSGNIPDNLYKNLTAPGKQGRMGL